MTASGGKVIVVTGATGLQGGAVTRHLLRDGWHVRALTRKAESKPARALKALGAEVVQGDMAETVSLRPHFTGAYGVYSVQNPFIGGPVAEVRQGKAVADVAKESGVQHLVYASTGNGRPGTGIPSWETKLEVEAYMKGLGLPLTILRPVAFMELMTHRKFLPAVTTWHVMPLLIGSTRPIPWVCTDDLGAVAARTFATPQAAVGHTLTLASDVRSLDECRAIYREVMGRNPPHLPVPVSLFRHLGFVGKDLTTMWGWLGREHIDLDTAPMHDLHPAALSVRDWLSKQETEVRPHNGSERPAARP